MGVETQHVVRCDDSGCDRTETVREGGLPESFGRVSVSYLLPSGDNGSKEHWYCGEHAQQHVDYLTEHGFAPEGVSFTAPEPEPEREPENAVAEPDSVEESEPEEEPEPIRYPDPGRI